MFRFAPDFRARLLRLLDALKRAEGGVDGGEAGRRLGRVEFKDRRPYESGDDVRFVDWAAFLRSDALVVKTFFDDEAPEAIVVLDRSASTGPDGSRQDRALRELAAASGFLATARGGRARLYALDASGARPVMDARGRAGTDAFLRAVETCGPTEGPADFDACASLSFPRRPGVDATLLSDFLAPTPPFRAFAAAGASGRATAFLVLAHEDPLVDVGRGAATLADPETGARLSVRSDSSWRAAYAQARAAHVQAIERAALARGLKVVPATGGEPLEDLVFRARTRRG
jgi:uncharacterized protein (DUF58 family)